MNTLEYSLNRQLLNYNPQSNLPLPNIQQLQDLYSEHTITSFQPCNLLSAHIQPSLQQPKNLKAKQFKYNSQCLLSVFTIEYLKLSYLQLQTKNHSALIHLILELIEQQQFDIVLLNPNNPLSKCPQHILKGIVKQFMTYIHENYRQESVQKILAKYPLVMDLFTGIYLTLLQLGEVINQPDEHLQIQPTYNLLVSYFEIQASFNHLNRCICFHQNNTYVLQTKTGQVYLIEQHQQQQPPQKQFDWPHEEQQSDDNRFIVHIDGQILSRVLSENSIHQKELDDEQEVIRHISNIEIPRQPEFEKQKNYPYNYKLAQSEIIKEKKCYRPNSKDIKKRYEQQSNVAISVTTTFSSFRENSVKGNVKDSFKAFIEAPSILKSQFLDIPTFTEITRKTSGFNQIIKSSTHDHQPSYDKYRSDNSQTRQSNQQLNVIGKTSLVDNHKLLEAALPNNELTPQPSFIRCYAHEQQSINNPISQSSFNNSNYIAEFNSRSIPDRESNVHPPKTQYTHSCILEPEFIESCIVEPSSTNTILTTGRPQLSHNRTLPPTLRIPLNPSTSPSSPKKWLNKNITKQFTSSFILQSIPEPYKSRIQVMKTKARKQRKSIYQSNNYFG